MHVYSPIKIPAQDSTFFEDDNEIRAPIKWVPCVWVFLSTAGRRQLFTGRKLYGLQCIWNEEGDVDKKFGGNEHENVALSLISTILPGTCATFYVQLHYCNKLENIWNSTSTLREDFRSSALTMITWEHLTLITGVGLTESDGSFWQLNSITGFEEHKVFFWQGEKKQCDN